MAGIGPPRGWCGRLPSAMFSHRGQGWVPMPPGQSIDSASFEVLHCFPQGAGSGAQGWGHVPGSTVLHCEVARGFALMSPNKMPVT